MNQNPNSTPLRICLWGREIMAKIKPKGYKYSKFKDTQKMIELNNFGKKCKNCKKEMTTQESKKPIGLCNKCEIT